MKREKSEKREKKREKREKERKERKERDFRRLLFVDHLSTKNMIDDLYDFSFVDHFSSNIDRERKGRKESREQTRA